MPTFFRTSIRRLMTSSLMVLLCICTANAYTLVMRGGRRVEIPSEFVVTARTVTYEAGQGIQITLQLAGVDIPATEQANHEPAGSFLRRAAIAQYASPPSPAPMTPARRTITNRDLQAAMIRRKQSELAYEKRRQELGLPTVAETRQREEADAVAFRSERELARSADNTSESYWRTRASSLRTEIAAVNAQMDYVRGRLEETSNAQSYNSPYGVFGRPYPNVYPNGPYGYPTTPGIGGGIIFGGGTSQGGLILGNRYPYPPVYGNGYPIDPYYGSGSYGYPGYDYSYERSALVKQYDQLATERTGLQVRWRAFEEEARRAGVPPGWLRP